MNEEDLVDAMPGNGDPVEEAPARRRKTARAADAPAESAPLTPAVPAEDFWTAVAGRDESFWDAHACYLYRTFPQVMGGMSSKHNYISIFSRNFDIEDVRKLHGGGGYKAVLKDQANRKQARPDFFFSIEGDPKFIAGQRFKDTGEPVPVGTVAPTAIAPVPAADGTAALVRELAAVLKSDKPAESALADAMKIMQQASSAGMEIMKAGIITQGNGGGNAVQDKIVAAALENMLKPKDSLGDALVLIEKLRKMDRPDREERDNPAGEMGMLKEMFGGDTLADLVMRGLKGEGNSAPGWQTILANAASKLADNLPQILTSVERLIQQQVQIAMMRNGGQPPRPALNPAPGPVNGRPVTITAPAVQPVNGAQPTQPAAAQPGTTGPAQPSQAEVSAHIDRILQSVVTSFNEGDTGDLAAMVVMRTFPELVPSLLPFFTDTATVIAFANTDARLQSIVGHEEFAEFATDFVKKLNNPGWIPPEEDEEEDPDPAPILLKKSTQSPTNPPDGPQPA